MKVCNKCKIQKPFSEFFKNKNGKDGLANPCKACRKQYYQSHLKKINDAKREIKKMVLGYYCKNNQARCVLCGYDKLPALSIDHVNGGGGKHRKELGGKSGNAFYRWLIQNNFPNGYRTLCFNCQFLERDRLHQVRKA